MTTFKNIILILLFIFPTISINAQQLYIVSVGIANYQYINDLTYTEDDVHTFNQIMSQHGAEISTIVGAQATHANILKTVRSVFAKATASDEVIFFFSGHGYEGGFCCYDMKQNSYLGGMSYQEIQILFRNCRAGRKFIIADACFSGGLSKQRTALTVQSVQKSDIIFLLSSQFDETSLELPNGPNGLFTYVLSKGLSGLADKNSDRKITCQELYDFTYTNVTDYANQIPHNQHPKMWGNGNKNLEIISY